MMLTDQELRLEALRLAVSSGVPENRDAFYIFLRGGDEAEDWFVAQFNKVLKQAFDLSEQDRVRRSFGDRA